MTRTTVIVGAGPVGLWLAAELRLRDVPVVIIEELEQRVPYSKAMTIHPRTIELFAQRGVHDVFLDRGIPLPAGHFGALEQRLDFSALDTPFPFTLLFPQAATEEILENRARELGADIRRGHRFSDFTEGVDDVEVFVDGPNGRYTITAAYLAGCDGVASAVRAAAGIEFPGSDATVFGFLADVTLDEPPAVPLYGHSSESGQLMIVPMPGGGHRIVGMDPAAQALPHQEFGLAELRSSVKAITGTDFGLRDPTWISRYGNGTRLAAQYRRGRVVLAGDSAHMHFPAGGAGMNVGIQDAAALGWRLGDVLAGFAPEGILDDYHSERHPVGDDLVLSSQAQTAVICAFDADRQALRALLNQLIASDPELNSLLAARLSGLSVTYPREERSHPAVGSRAPEIGTAPRSLYTALSFGDPVLVDTCGAARSFDPGLARVGVRVLEVDPEALSGVLSGATVALVRPDGHIAWATDAAATSAPLELEPVLRAFRPGAFDRNASLDARQ